MSRVVPLSDHADDYSRAKGRHPEQLRPAEMSIDPVFSSDDKNGDWEEDFTDEIDRPNTPNDTEGVEADPPIVPELTKDQILLEKEQVRGANA